MLVKSCLVFGKDGTTPADVRISDGLVKEIGNLSPLEGEGVIDGSGRLMAPGLVNAHYHSGECFNKGVYENFPLELWFIFSHNVLCTSRKSEREIYLRTLLGCMEMLKSGVTSVVDMIFEAPWPTPESISAIMRAYRDAGMRCRLIIGMADKPFYQTIPLLPERLPNDLRDALDKSKELPAQEWMALARQVVSEWHGAEKGMLSIGMGPSAPHRCTEELLEQAAGFAEENNLPLHVHCLETKVQAVSGGYYYGKSMVKYLQEIGLLSGRTSLIHAVWPSQKDIEIVSNSGISIVHCLLSNLRLGSGISPIPRMLKAGVNIGLGTDGAGCNDSLDIFELMKMVALIHKVHGPNYEEWLKAEDAWEMATTGGARCAGFSGVGNISVGSKADLVLLKLDSPSLTPLNNCLRQLVYSLPSRYVDKVIAGGKLVVDNGKLTLIDEQKVWAEVKEIAQDLKSGQSKLFSCSDQLFQIGKEIYRNLTEKDVGYSRYISF